MVGKIAVVPEQDYVDFLQGLTSSQGTSNPVDGTPAQKGRNLFLKLNCIVCHTAKGDAQAPVLEELFGVTKKVLVLQSDGKYALEEVTIDDAYILESIINPRAKLTQPWDPVMPGHFAENTTAEERNHLVQFIKSLKRGQTPDRTEKTPSAVGAPNTTPQTPTSEVKKP